MEEAYVQLWYLLSCIIHAAKDSIKLLEKFSESPRK